MKPFRVEKIKREVGQWVDVLDGCGQWMEGQIIKKNGAFLFIHFNNCPNSWDEWIA